MAPPRVAVCGGLALSSGNLTVQPMEDVLTREVIDAQGLEFYDTDYLKTIVVVLPKCVPCPLVLRVSRVSRVSGLGLTLFASRAHGSPQGK